MPNVRAFVKNIVSLTPGNNKYYVGVQHHGLEEVSSLKVDQCCQYFIYNVDFPQKAC